VHRVEGDNILPGADGFDDNFGGDGADGFGGWDANGLGDGFGDGFGGGGSKDGGGDGDDDQLRSYLIVSYRILLNFIVLFRIISQFNV